MTTPEEGTHHLLRSKLFKVNMGQGRLDDWAQGDARLAWYEAQPKILEEIQKLGSNYTLLGFRGTCTSDKTFSTNGITVLCPADVLKRGHERVDRDGFQVTRLVPNKPEAHNISVQHAYYATADLIQQTGNKKIYPTFVLYDPNKIVTRDRVNPIDKRREKNLFEIPDDYYRANMHVKGNPANAIVKIIQLAYKY